MAVMAAALHQSQCARPFRVLVPVIPALGVAVNIYMMVNLGWVNWARLMHLAGDRPGDLSAHSPHSGRVRRMDGGARWQEF